MLASLHGVGLTYFYPRRWRLTWVGVVHHQRHLSMAAYPCLPLRKEREATIGDVEDAWRDAEEEQLIVAMVENVQDATQVEAAHLRVELRRTGCPLSPLCFPWVLGPASRFPCWFDVSNPLLMQS